MSDRLVGKKELRTLVLYSDAHIARMEADGRFPKRLRLGNGPRCRVGWLFSEVMAWLQQQTAKRDALRQPTLSQEVV